MHACSHVRFTSITYACALCLRTHFRWIRLIPTVCTYLAVQALPFDWSVRVAPAPDNKSVVAVTSNDASSTTAAQLCHRLTGCVIALGC